MPEVGTLEIAVEVAILTIDSPPVNALGAKVRQAIDKGFAEAVKNDAVKAIVLICGGRTFFAGADISEFGKPFEEPELGTLFSRLEQSPKLLVAAIHGTALGGGLEAALVSNYRIAVASAKFGLPEVTLGILPGAGGTQRLPRVIGVERALEMMTSGQPIGSSEATALGLIDAVAAEGSLREDAIAFARKLLAQGAPLKKVRDLDGKLDEIRQRPAFFDEFRKKHAKAFRGFKAPENIIRAVEASLTLRFDEGIIRETELFAEVAATVEAAAMQHAFFAERNAKNIPGLTSDTPVLPIKSVAIIGAGTMGGGIAMNFINIGVPVTLVEANSANLERGVSVIRGNYNSSVKRGRLTAEAVEKRMGLITPSLDFSAIASADLVIEAVFESMPVKKEIFSKIDGIAKSEAILATNTSFLDVNEIAGVTKRPEQVLGLHFFSPANVMRLLEVVRGAKTSASVIATGMALARKIGKVAVLSGVCNGFIANRAMFARTAQADDIVLAGVAPADVDRILTQYGFAMGHFAMMDLVGLDVVGRELKEETAMGNLVAMGRWGRKQNGGYYDYDTNGVASPSPVAQEVIDTFAKKRGVARRTFSDEDILAQLLYPVVNEGAKILDEGIALRASDIDLAVIAGYNWPVFTGGPMFWADSVGLPVILEKLKSLQAEFGDRFKPSSLLEKLVAEGKTFCQR